MKKKWLVKNVKDIYDLEDTLNKLDSKGYDIFSIKECKSSTVGDLVVIACLVDEGKSDYAASLPSDIIDSYPRELQNVIDKEASH